MHIVTVLLFFPPYLYHPEGNDPKLPYRHQTGLPQSLSDPLTFYKATPTTTYCFSVS
jgi:hypothetical protein